MNHLEESAIVRLTRYLSGESGVESRTLRTVRVSSAQARGRAGRYPYWGAVRYQVRLSRQGWPINIALERASSDRRSVRLAMQDAERTGRILCSRIGRLRESDAEEILQELGDRWIARREASSSSRSGS